MTFFLILGVAYLPAPQTPADSFPSGLFTAVRQHCPISLLLRNRELM